MQLLSNERRFILAVVAGALVISNRKKADIEAQLARDGYDRMPPSKKVATLKSFHRKAPRILHMSTRDGTTLDERTTQAGMLCCCPAGKQSQHAGVNAQLGPFKRTPPSQKVQACRDAQASTKTQHHELFSSSKA